MITRRIIREEYGFEARHTSLNQGVPYGTSDAEIMAARRLVMQIRESLEPFNFEPRPEDDGKTRVDRAIMTLDNGAEYEGEWDD